MFELLFFSVFIWIIVQLIRNLNLMIICSKLSKNQTNDLVNDYIKYLRFTVINNYPKEWQKLRNAFFVVYGSKNVSADLKKKLYDSLQKKGCNLGNVNLNFLTEEDRIRNSGEEGERRVAYTLKWLSNEYRILTNIKLKSIVGVQEFDNILIGPNGVFHIETKNYGGERGCKIKINTAGNWIREDNGSESGVESPEFQLDRHDTVLKENLDRHYGEGKYVPHGIIVLSNPKTILEGVENSEVTVIKADSLVKCISKYENSERLSQESVDNIYDKLQLISK